MANIDKKRISKVYDLLANVSKQMTDNLASWKDAKAKGDDKLIAKYVEVARKLTAEKQKLTKELDSLVNDLDKDVELMVDENIKQTIRENKMKKSELRQIIKEEILKLKGSSRKLTEGKHALKHIKAINNDTHIIMIDGTKYTVKVDKWYGESHGANSDMGGTAFVVNPNGTFEKSYEFEMTAYKDNRTGDFSDFDVIGVIDWFDKNKNKF